MSVLTVVMMGTASTLVLASRAIPQADDPLTFTVKGVEAADQLAGDLSCALSFTLRTATAVEFTVADRNGDLADETLRYEWSGTPGDPLTRQVNGGAAAEVAREVQQFALQFGTRSKTTTTEVTKTVTVGPALFATFEGWTGLTISNRDWAATASSWCAERFIIDRLTFPADASDIRITKAEIKMKVAGTGTLTTMGIHKPLSTGSTQPATASIGTAASLASSTLPFTYDWRPFDFSDVVITGLPNEFVFVVKGTNPSSAYVRYLQATLGPADNQTMRWTTNSGGSWSPSASLLNQQDIPFRVYGTYKTAQKTQEVQTRSWLRSVGITLRLGTEESSGVQTEIQVLNTPEVTP